MGHLGSDDALVVSFIRLSAARLRGRIRERADRALGADGICPCSARRVLQPSNPIDENRDTNVRRSASVFRPIVLGGVV